MGTQVRFLADNLATASRPVTAGLVGHVERVGRQRPRW
jgi:hypothetical protein